MDEIVVVASVLFNLLEKKCFLEKPNKV